MGAMRWVLFLLAAMFVACTPVEEPYDTGDSDTATGPDIDPDQQINFPDPVLRACVEKLIYGKNPGDPIYAKDVATKTKIDCDSVSDLTGMEFFHNLETVYFSDSNINSLNPIKNNINIDHLTISGGGVKNLNDISELVNLTTLSFGQSALEDISALSGKNKLTYIHIFESKINTIAALASLEEIKTIDVPRNPLLTTLGAQFTAPKLVALYVDNCGLTSLNELSGLPELKTVAASDNYLTDISFMTTLPKLEGIGIDGNCLSESAMQVYVDWYNAKYPDNQKTVEEAMQYQNPDNKCQ